MSSDDIAIRVQGLGKCFQIYDTPRDRLKQFVMPKLRRFAGRASRQYFQEFWALKDISFDIRKGETVGIVGRNGSGKSTLLQIICGTLTPTEGEVQTCGRIAALLELGSGFNPEFSGRDNVYLNAALLGLSKEEVDARFDDIAAFADIGKFIEQPVKSYSSGMMVRLAFAVQSQIDPDILIVDEALAVGDAKFQAKCFDRLRQLKENGASILLVTHSSEQVVTHCSSAILLNNGVQMESGEPRQVINRYLDLLFGKEKKDIESPDVAVSPVGSSSSASPTTSRSSTSNEKYALSNKADVFSTRTGYNPHEYRWGDGLATLLDFYLSANGEAYPAVLRPGQEIVLAVSARFNAELHRPILGITIKTKEGVTVYGANSETLDCEEFRESGAHDSVVQIEASFSCRLAPGDYFVSLGLSTRHGEDITPHDRRYDSIHIQVAPDRTFFGLVDLGLNLRVLPAAS